MNATEQKDAAVRIHALELLASALGFAQAYLTEAEIHSLVERMADRGSRHKVEIPLEWEGSE